MSWLKNYKEKKSKLRFDSFTKRRLDDYRHCFLTNSFFISGTINNFGVSSVYCEKRNKKLVPFPQYTEETPKLFIVSALYYIYRINSETIRKDFLMKSLKNGSRVHTYNHWPLLTIKIEIQNSILRTQCFVQFFNKAICSYNKNCFYGKRVSFECSLQTWIISYFNIRNINSPVVLLYILTKHDVIFRISI